ncbi:MAG: heat-stable protein [Pyrinomonas methylaliphatogenes]|jgi:Icc-related predicted phosphoesterase|nr:heat-stable protein [Pyrinomonas methylaliphatogenes]
MRKTTRRIIATSNPRNELDKLERFTKLIPDADADALIILGNLAPRQAKTRDYARIFRLLAQIELPTFYLPGPEDAPIEEYLREAANIEVVHPQMHSVHGSYAFAPGHLLVAGLGGEIADDPDATREEREQLRYPGWEAEYRLKILWELKDYPKLLLFATPPAHKGLGEGGSQTVAELIKTHNPKAAFVSGKGRKQERLGDSWVIVPGSLADGEFSLVDLHEGRVEAGAIS